MKPWEYLVFLIFEAVNNRNAPAFFLVLSAQPCDFLLQLSDRIDILIVFLLEFGLVIAQLCLSLKWRKYMYQSIS